MRLKCQNISLSWLQVLLSAAVAGGGVDEPAEGRAGPASRECSEGQQRTNKHFFWKDLEFAHVIRREAVRFPLELFETRRLHTWAHDLFPEGSEACGWKQNLTRFCLHDSPHAHVIEQCFFRTRPNSTTVHMLTPSDSGRFQSTRLRYKKCKTIATFILVS